MKTTIQRKEFIDALKRASQTINKRSTLPIISYALLCATSKTGKYNFSVSGTDLTNYLTISLKASVTETGSICADITRLEKCLRALDTDTVTLETYYIKTKKGQHTFIVTAGNISTEIPCASPDDFVPFPSVSGNSITLKNIPESLGEVDYAISTDDTRPALKSVYLTTEKTKVVAVATDAFRLAKTTLKCRNALSKSIIIPSETVRLIKNNFHNCTLTIPNEDHPNNVLVKGDNLELVFCPIQATYPNYTAYTTSLTKVKTTRAIFNKGDMLKALKVMAAAVVSEYVSLKSKGQNLIISNSNKDEDEAKMTITIPFKGKINKGYPLAHLQELVARLDETVTLNVPTVEGPLTTKNTNTLHLLMPIVRPY